MAVVTKAVLKSYFENGKVPNYDKYVDLVDTMGDGDMLKSVYDTNDDGKVNSAAAADLATNSNQLGGVVAANYLQRTSAARPGVTKLYRIDSDSGYYVRHYWTGTHWYLQGYNSSDVFHAGCRVEYANTAPWTGISGKPSTYPPSAHTHPGGDITSQVGDANTVDSYHASDLYRDNANFATSGYLDTSSYVDAAGGFRINGSQGYIPILYNAGSFLLNGDWDFGELKSAQVYTITRSVFAYPSTARAVILRIAGQTGSGTGYIGCNNVSTNYAYSVAINTISDHPHSSSGMVRLTSTGGSFYIRIGNASAYCQVQVIGYCL